MMDCNTKQTDGKATAPRLENLGEFLRAIHPEVSNRLPRAASDLRRISIFTLPGEASRLFANAEDAEAFIERLPATMDVYHRCTSIVGNPAGRGKKEDTGSVSCVWCDIDVAGGAHTGGNLPASKEEAIAFLDGLPVPPSVVVDSGHGYWPLTATIILNSEEDRNAAEKLTWGWHGLVCIEAAKRGWELENLGDLTRVLRVPGTFNNKLIEDRRPVVVVRSTGKLHDADMLRSFLPSESAEPRSVPPAADSHSNGNGTSHGAAPMARCCKYLDTIPPSIQGKNGGTQTLMACRAISRFGLDGDAARQAFDHYNVKCVPPWVREDEITHKISEGRKLADRDGEFGAWIERGGEVWRAGDDDVDDDKIANGKCKAPPKKKSDADEIGLVKLLADEITRTDSFAQDESGRLFHFHAGAYRAHGDTIVKARVKALCVRWDRSKEWSTRRALETIEYIRIDAHRLWDAPPADRINVKNGILLIADRKLLPHDPLFLSTVQLPVEYDPAATCPAIEKFVSEVFPPDAAAVAYETVGWLAVPDTSLQKAILLTGEGANGKSVYLRLVTTFLGRGNVSGVSLHRLEADRFTVARLSGKLANICADLPSDHLQGTSTFKALVGGDTMLGEHKFLTSFEFVSFARLVFSANHPPRSSDASHAFFRRWLVVPFNRTFEPADQIPGDVLDARLSTPPELSGLLNRALDAYQAMKRRGGFSEPESILAAWNEFHATTDPLAVWLDRYTIDDPNAQVPSDDLRVAYNASREREGCATINRQAFGRTLHRLRPAIEDRQRMVGEKLRWCYIGIGLIADASQNTQSSGGDSHDSHERGIPLTGVATTCSVSEYAGVSRDADGV